MLLVLLLHMHTTTLDEAKTSTLNQTTPLTEQQLQQFYRGFNETYFNGNLPDIPVTYSDEIYSQFGALGMTTCHSGDKTGETCHIRLASQFKDASSTILEAELHEACHVSLEGQQDTDDHGPKFQKCMKRLANADAFEGIW